MSRSSLSTLLVNASLPTTRISVLDSSLQSVGQQNAAGSLEISLPPGIYRVVFHEGSAALSKDVPLQQETLTLEQGPSLNFVSPIPIPGTATTHPWHEEGLRVAWTAKVVRLARSARAGVFVFVRDIGQRKTDRTWPEIGTEPSGNPAAELRLVDARGHCVYDFGKQAAVSNTAERRYAAARFALHPGLWRLREGDDGAGVELALPTAEGWVTHVYAFARRESGGRTRVDLASASIWMTRLEQSELESDLSWRVRETALASLRARYPLVGAQPDAALRTGFEDPMLGLIGGYLHVLERTRGEEVVPDEATLRSLVGRLSALLGSSAPETLPDVAALRFLATGEASRITQPPIFGSSFDVIRLAARKSPSWVQPGSLLSAVVPAVLYKNPWLIWSTKLAEWREHGRPSDSRPDIQSQRGQSLEAATGHSVPLPPMELLFLAVKELSSASLERVRAELPMAAPLLDAIRPEPRTAMQRALAETGLAPRAPELGAVSAVVDSLGWPETAVAELATVALHCATREFGTLDASAAYLYQTLDRWTESRPSPDVLTGVLGRALESNVQLAKKLLARMGGSDSRFSCAVYAAPSGPGADKAFFLRVAPLAAETRPSLQRLNADVFHDLNDVPQKLAPPDSYDQLSAGDVFQSLGEMGLTS